LDARQKAGRGEKPAAEIADLARAILAKDGPQHVAPGAVHAEVGPRLKLQQFPEHARLKHSPQHGALTST